MADTPADEKGIPRAFLLDFLFVVLLSSSYLITSLVLLFRFASRTDAGLELKEVTLKYVLSLD